MSEPDTDQAIEPGAAIGFVGLGRMGRPMAARLAGAGYRVLGYDVSGPAARAWAEHVADDRAARAVPALADVADGAAAIVLMLPDSAVVTDVLVEPGPARRAAARHGRRST